MNYANHSSQFGYQFVSQAPGDVRADFVRKVYSLFYVSLIVTVLTGAFACQPDVLPAALGLRMPLLIVGLIVGFGMQFAQNVPGLNIGLLMAYSVIQGALLGPLLTLVERFAPGVPMQAGVITLAIFGGLSFYAITSKKDFSFMGGALTAGVIGLFVVGILLMFFHSPVVSLFYAGAGVVIFSGFVLYDTSQIMNKLAPNQVVGGAISLYLDFILLFMFVLRLLSELNGGGSRRG